MCQALPNDSSPIQEVLAHLPGRWADSACDFGVIQTLWAGEMDQKLKNQRKAVTSVCVNVLKFYIGADCYQSLNY